MTKKILTACAIVVAILAVAAGLAYHRLQQEIASGELGRRIGGMIREKTGREVTLGAIRIVPPLSVEVADFHLAPARGSGAGLTLKAIRVSVALDALLTGKLALRSVTIVGPDLQIVRQPDGSSNLPELLGLPDERHSAGRAPTAPAGSEAAPKPAPELSELPFERIAVSEGKLSFREAAWPEGKTLELKQLEASLDLPRPGSPEAGFTFQTATAGGIFAATGSYDANRKSAKVQGRASSLDLGQLAAALPAGTLPISVGRFPLEARFQVTVGKTIEALELSASFEGGELGVGPQAIPIGGVHGALKLSAGTLELDGVAGLVAGAIPVELKGKITNVLGTPGFELKLEMADTDLGRLAASGLATVPKGASGSISGHLAIGGTAEAPRLEGEFIPRGLRWTLAAGGVEVPVAVEKGSFKLTPARAATEGLVIQLGEQPVDAAFEVDDYVGARRWKGRLKVASAEAAALMALAPAEVRERALALSPRGKLSLSLDASGTGTDYTMSGELVPAGLSASLPVEGGSVPLSVRSGKVRFAQDRAFSENLALDVAGVSVQVSVQADHLLSKPHAVVSVKIPSLAVDEVVARLPAGLQNRLSPYGLSGKLRADATIETRGTGQAQMSGSIDAKGLRGHVVQGGQQVTFEVVKGLIEPAGDKLKTRGLEVAFSLAATGRQGASGSRGAPSSVDAGAPPLHPIAPSGGSLEISGDVSPLASPPRLSLEVVGSNIDLEMASAFAPDLPVKLEGVGGFTAKVRGPLTAPESAVVLEMRGIGVVHPMLGQALVGRSGKLGYDGSRLVASGVRFGLGGSDVSLEGSIEDPLGTGTFRDLKFSGRLALTDLRESLASMTAIRLEGAGTVEGQLTGNRAAAEVAGTGRFSDVTVMLPGKGGQMSKLQLATASCRFTAGAEGVTVSPLEAQLYGGNLAAQLESAATGAMSMDLKLKGADFGQVMADMQGMPGAFTGRLDTVAKLQMGREQGLAGLSGSGQSVIEGLVVNGKALGASVPGFKTVKKAQKLSKWGAIAGALAGKKTLLGQFGAGASALDEKYGPMLEFAMSEHDFGTVRYDFQANQGTLSGPVKTTGGKGNLEGSLQIELGAGTARGDFALAVTDGAQSLTVRNIVLDNTATVAVSTRNGIDDFDYSSAGGSAPVQAGGATEPEAAGAAPTAGEEDATTRLLGEALPGGEGTASALVGGLKGLFGGKKKPRQPSPPPAPRGEPAAPVAPVEQPPAAEPTKAAPAVETQAPAVHPGSEAPPVTDAVQPAAEPVAATAVSEPPPQTGGMGRRRRGNRATPTESPAPATETPAPAAPADPPPAAEPAKPAPAEEPAPAAETPATETPAPAAEPPAPAEPAEPPPAAESAKPAPAEEPAPATETPAPAAEPPAPAAPEEPPPAAEPPAPSAPAGPPTTPTTS